MAKRYDEISQEDAESAIKKYNSGLYAKTGRFNIQIDREGRNLFEEGIGESGQNLKRQLSWIVDEYGGWAFRVDSDILIDEITAKILNIHEYYNMLRGLEPLLNSVPDKYIIERIYEPFQTPFELGGRSFCNWMTMASKFWHFVNQDAFTILDSHSSNFYRIKRSADPTEKYLCALRVVHNIMQNKGGLLRMDQLREIDGEHYQGDIKLIDKIAYQLGGP